jgi:xanthine dehydrogenase molybdopterin-binding subunit B
VADVEVDLDTFELRVVRFFSAVDVGKGHQPQMVVGQIEGGSLQGDRLRAPRSARDREGRFVHDRMSTCIVPTTLDAPGFEVELVEIPSSTVPSAPRGRRAADGRRRAGSALGDRGRDRTAHGAPAATPERLMEAWLVAHPEERL